MLQPIVELSQDFASSLGQIFGAISVWFNHNFQYLHTVISQQPEWLSWPLVGMLILVGIWLIWHGLAVKSRLLLPTALNLDPDNPEHLSGRQEDLDALVAAVILRPLVFLEGETGVGKTALIRAGLIPTLNKTDSASGIIPIYINCYGDDWDHGLQQRLITVIWQHLSKSTPPPGPLPLTGEEEKFATPPPGHLPLTGEGGKIGGVFMHSDSLDKLRELLLSEHGTQGIFQRLHEELGQRILVIFDQFDDYIARHHLLLLREGRWITAKELVANNEFWRGARGAIEHKTLHCLFVVRRRWSMAMESMRFIPPVQRTLDLVNAKSIARLLAQLITAQSTKAGVDNKPPVTVIANPNVGWIALKDLLIQDLTMEGRILPIQARIAFNGLRVLPELSIAAYEAAGELEGIELMSVHSAVDFAAKYARVSKIQVQKALRVLVDESIPLLPKGMAAPQSSLFKAANVDVGRGSRMLAALESSGLIRSIVNVADRSSSENCGWLLYHDYLARLIIAMQRHSNRWQRLLQARRRTFYAVEGLRAKWRALIAPGEQLRLLLETVHGRVNWHGHRSFGVISSIRFLPLIVALLIVLMGTRHVLYWQQCNVADQILFTFRNTETHNNIVDQDILRQLWMIAAASPQLKLILLERSLTDRNSHPQLIAHLDRVILSLFGIDPRLHKRRQALSTILTVTRENGITQQAMAYPALLAASIYATAPADLQEFAASLASRINMAMYANSDNDQLAALGLALSSLGTQLPPNVALTGTERLVDAMRTAKDSVQIVRLGMALNSFGERTPPIQAKLAAELLVAMMRDTADRNILVELGQVLAGIGIRLLPPEQAYAGARRLVEIMGESTDREQMEHLALAVNKLAENMPPLQIQAVAVLLAKIMGNSSDIDQLTRLGTTLIQLVAKIPAAEAVAMILADALRDNHDQQQRAVLSQFFSQVVENLAVSQIQTVVSDLTRLMSTIQNPDQLADLGRVFGKLINLPSVNNNPTFIPYIQTATDQLAGLMATLAIPRHLAELGDALAAFGSILPTIHIEAATTKLVEAMLLSTSPRQLSMLGQTLSSFGTLLPKNTAQTGAMRLVEIIETGVDNEHLQTIGTVLGALGIRLQQARPVIERSLATINQNPDRDNRIIIIKTLIPLLQYLSPNDAQIIAEQIITSMTTANNQDSLAAQGQILGILLNLQPQDILPQFHPQAKKGAELLTEAMRACNDWEQLAVLGTALGQLTYKHFTEQKQQSPAQSELQQIVNIGADRLIETMQASIIPQQLVTLGQALSVLGPILSPEQAQSAALRLVTVMRTSNAPAQLAKLARLLKNISNWLLPPQIHLLSAQLVNAMHTSSDSYQIIQLGWVLSSIEKNLPVDAARTGAERLVEIMQVATVNQQLIDIATIINHLKNILPPALLQATAENLGAAMREHQQVPQLAALGQALGNLLIANDTNRANAAIAAQIQAGCEKIVAVLLNTVEPIQIEQLHHTLSNLSIKLPPFQRQIVAERLVEAMLDSNDWHQLMVLRDTYRDIATEISPSHIYAGSARLVNLMQHTTSITTFNHKAKLLDAFPVSADLSKIPAVVELLKGPLAVGEAKVHILKFIGRLAGTKFNTMDNFIEWSRSHLPIDLSQPPLYPF